MYGSRNWNGASGIRHRPTLTVPLASIYIHVVRLTYKLEHFHRRDYYKYLPGTMQVYSYRTTTHHHDEYGSMYTDSTVWRVKKDLKSERLFHFGHYSFLCTSIALCPIRTSRYSYDTLCIVLYRVMCVLGIHVHVQVNCDHRSRRGCIHVFIDEM